MRAFLIGITLLITTGFILPALAKVNVFKNQEAPLIEPKVSPILDVSTIDALRTPQNFKKVYHEILKNNNIQTPYLFKQKALNQALLKDTSSSVSNLVVVYQKEGYFIAPLDDIKKATFFEHTLVEDTENRTVFKTPFDEKKFIFNVITHKKKKSKEVCKLWSKVGLGETPIEAETRYNLDTIGHLDSYWIVTKECLPLDIFLPDKDYFSGQYLSQLTEWIKQTYAPEDKDFQFQQKALNYPVCKKDVLCTLYLKDKSVDFSLEVPFKIYFMSHNLIKDTPYETVFETPMEWGKTHYTRIKLDSLLNPCVLFVRHGFGNDVSDLDRDTSSFGGASSQAPFCTLPYY